MNIRGIRTFLTSLAVAVTGTSLSADPGVVSLDDLVPFGQLAWTAPDFELPKSSPGLPLLDLADKSSEAVLLRRLEKNGLAAGFENVIYDNHDRGHSLPETGMFPSLPKLIFAKDLKKLDLDYGLAGRIILPAIVIGNSSTALTKGKAKRSQARLSMTMPDGPARAFLTYVTNHLYLYPEHRDHDDADLFPANWPYMVITQGSSHSDRPFMRALFMTVAALSPETQKILQEKGLIAPALQMILRRSLKTIYTREAYLSGLAHPTVISKKQLAPERMISLAASLKPDEIPPMVYLTVEEEDFKDEAGLAGLSEKLFDTPSAIARSWRGPEFSRNMVVSAGKTADPNGHELQFSWVLLRGDPDKVRITPIGENGAKAEISVDWHETRQILPSHKRHSNRVDIGVFAWNGFHDSAPAFISIDFPGHQVREYMDIPGAYGKRLVSIDYDARAKKAPYDPLIFWTAPWKDEMIYDETARLIEIKRVLQDETMTLATPNYLSNGKPVSYTLKDSKKDKTLSMAFDVTQ